jgi:lipopolysaccharide transport system permease protein
MRLHRIHLLRESSFSLRLHFVMNSKLEAASEPATVPSIVIEPVNARFRQEVKELWQARELFYFLAWRDMKTRYAQAAIGVGWAIIQPLLTTIIFTVVFSYWAKVPSDGLPYPVFAYAAILPWTLFARSLERSTLSVVSESGLIKKVYFPRLIIPIVSTFINLVDFVVGFVILIIMMLWYQLWPTWGIIAIPLFVSMALMTSLSISLWLSAINVKFRDVASVVPLLTQLWMFASPVLYPSSIVPEQLQSLYALNPMAGVIEGFRWAMLGKQPPNWLMVTIGFCVVSTLFLAGVMFFKRVERTFADII